MRVEVNSSRGRDMERFISHLTLVPLENAPALFGGVQNIS